MTEPPNDPGLTDPGTLPVDHPYCVALEAGWFGDHEVSDPMEHDNERYTVAGVIAAAKEAA